MRKQVLLHWGRLFECVFLAWVGELLSAKRL